MTDADAVVVDLHRRIAAALAFGEVVAGAVDENPDVRARIFRRVRPEDLFKRLARDFFAGVIDRKGAEALGVGKARTFVGSHPTTAAEGQDGDTGRGRAEATEEGHRPSLPRSPE
jgi:hypothetical protein